MKLLVLFLKRQVPLVFVQFQGKESTSGKEVLEVGTMVSVSRDLLEREPGERGASPVSEERRQGKKGNTATEYCNMAAVGFLSQTAVPLTKRSSSHPRGVRLVSPNLSAVLLYLATSG